MVVDSGCINTVCGDVWLDSYLESLSCKDKKSVAMENSSSWFRFGNGASFQSLKKVTIPVYLGSIRARISTDVVKYEIPLLFSKNSLKKGQGSINFSKDTIRILNQYLTLENTSTGHYILRLSRNPDSPVEELKDVLFSVNLDDMDQAKLRSTALKWHRQFAHPPAAKLINLLRRANIEHPDMVDTITKVTDSCNTCLRYRKPPHRPAVAFPLASRFNQTVAIDLKDIKPGIKIIHMVDHATRYGQACLVKNKSSSEIVKRIFELWIRVFGCPEQLLTDNGGEFNNKEYLDLCDKCNIKVLTTAAESPWSNGLVEKHNGILGHMVTKMLEDEPIDAELAIHWAVAAKNALTTVYGFSPNLLVFGRDPAMPNTMQNSIAANDPEFYSSIVRDNLNALHKARESFLHQEASEKLSRALSKQTRTYSDRSFLNNDEVFYKRDHSSRWQGPAKILGRDSNQVLIKHGGSYLRVHPCRLLSTNTPQEKVCVNKNNSPEEGPADASDECSSDDDGPSKSPEKGLVGASDESSSDDDGPSRSYHTPEDSIASQPQLEPSSEDEVYQEATPDQAPDSGHANFKDSSQASGKITPGKTLKHIPKKNQIINYRIIGENQTRKATCLGRGGKASTNSWHYINVHDHDSDTKRCLSVKDDMQSWEICNDTLIAIKTDIFAAAKQAELDKWKSMNVYTETEDTGQRRISTRWVCTERLKAGKIEAKARLCARGCEDPDDVATDSPTCERDNVRILLSIAASNNWTINSIDFKSAYLQGEDLDRDIFLIPPKEANTKNLWKLNKCVYGINDAGRKWYNQLRKDIISLGSTVSQLDQAVFYMREAEKLAGVIVLHVDDTLWAGNQSFETNVIRRLTENLLISTEEHGSMRYLGLALENRDNFITSNLNHCAQRMEEIPISPDRPDEEELTQQEIKKFRILSGQLNWLASQCRPDLSFSSCHVACSIKEGKVKDAKHANKVMRRAKGVAYHISYQDLGDHHNWRIVGFSDASWGNLGEGGSQGGYLIFIVGAEGTANLVSWQSRRLRRVARSTIAAETLALGDACESSMLIASQIAEIMGFKKLPITLVTDNESLANATHSTTSVEEKRLRIDISALRESLCSKEIDEIRWVPTQHQLADSLTKQGAKSDKLLAVVRQQMLSMSNLQFTPLPWSE